MATLNPHMRRRVLPTVDQLRKLDPQVAPYADALVTACGHYGVDTPTRVAMFLAQCAHETGGFQHIQENLNYSREALLQRFGHHFNGVADADAYARQPEKIANRVYADRMGNGPEASGEGWLFRGRGLIQLTGHASYAAYSKAAHGDDSCVLNPDLLLLPPDAAAAAGWFWSTHGCSALADGGDEAAFEAVTRKINGGLNGLGDRQAWWAKAKEALA